MAEITKGAWMSEQSKQVMPFTCPQCGGHYFGSTMERRLDGSIWKISEDCHDQHGVGCTWRKTVSVMVVAAK